MNIRNLGKNNKNIFSHSKSSIKQQCRKILKPFEVQQCQSANAVFLMLSDNMGLSEAALAVFSETHVTFWGTQQEVQSSMRRCLGPKQTM